MNDGHLPFPNHTCQRSYGLDEFNAMAQHMARFEITPAHYRQRAKLKRHLEIFKLGGKAALTLAILRQNYEWGISASVQTFYGFEKDNVSTIEVIPVMNKKYCTDLRSFGHRTISISRWI
jgi:hypothetical protein